MPPSNRRSTARQPQGVTLTKNDVTASHKRESAKQRTTTLSSPSNVPTTAASTNVSSAHNSSDPRAPPLDPHRTAATFAGPVFPPNPNCPVTRQLVNTSPTQPAVTIAGKPPSILLMRSASRPKPPTNKQSFQSKSKQSAHEMPTTPSPSQNFPSSTTSNFLQTSP